jgi:ABC-type transport system substrate-binding protein
MRHPRKKISVWCLLGICLASSFLFVLPVSAQDNIISFVVGKKYGPWKLDPLDAYDSESIDTIMQVCEGLYMYNYSSPEMECIPCLASEIGTWSFNGSGDLVILTIPLKESVTFHDGSKFNTSAVKWNFDRLQYWTYGWDVDGGDIFTDGDGILENHPLGTASKTLFSLKGKPILNRTEIIDEYTIRFILNFECVIWEKLLAFIACAMVLPDPDYQYDSIFFNRVDIYDELIGTGPFKLIEYSLDEQVVFDYNPDYHMTWGDDHIERMIYRIEPDDTIRDLAILNHEIHWGRVNAEVLEQYWADPDLIEIPKKAAIVYYIQMNLYNMKREYRYASSFIWNHTYFLQEVLGGYHYELHVPVPDGMQYHFEGFNGEPHYDVNTARDIILNSDDPDIQANLTSNGLTAVSTDQDWINVAESTTPLAVFNYTRYESSTVELCGILLQEYLKDIGIKLVVLPAIPWEDWVVIDPMEIPWDRRLCYSFGGWGPDYNDPIDMIEPLYGKDASSNIFGLDNATWNQMLVDTYSLTEFSTPTREEAFYIIQKQFCKYYVPSFYILQLGGRIGFNQAYIDEDSVGDMLNIMGDLYWFNIRFIPHSLPITPVEIILIYGFLGVIGIGILIGIPIIVIRKKSKNKHISTQRFSKTKTVYCPDCGRIIQNNLGMCDSCGKIVEVDRIQRYIEDYSQEITSQEIKYCPQCGSLVIENQCTKCGKKLFTL